MKYALHVLAGVNHLPHYESTRSLRKKGGRGSLLLFCEYASDQTSEMLILHRENFLQLGTPCEIVAKATGLSFEEVAQVLRNSLTASSVVSVSETQDSTRCRLGPIPI